MNDGRGLHVRAEFGALGAVDGWIWTVVLAVSADGDDPYRAVPVWDGRRGGGGGHWVACGSVGSSGESGVRIAVATRRASLPAAACRSVATMSSSASS